jgi:hypothetical protein
MMLVNQKRIEASNPHRVAAGSSEPLSNWQTILKDLSQASFIANVANEYSGFFNH